MFSLGLAPFALASLFGAVSQTLWQLTLARVLPGMGAASLMCMFGGLVRNFYRLRLLGRGISRSAPTVAVLSVVGLTRGSVVLDIAHSAEGRRVGEGLVCTC